LAGRKLESRSVDRSEIRALGRYAWCEPCSRSRTERASFPFARDLLALGVEVIATEGTRETLAAAGVDVRSVSDLTGSEPIAGGQVKTLHPAIYAGILARRDRPEQLAELEAQEIGLIDIVAVNVSPSRRRSGARLVPIDEATEMIDIGGAALLAAAARNYAGVAAVANPARYPQVIAEIKARGMVSAELRQRLAAEAYGLVAAYHAEIAAYLSNVTASCSRAGWLWSSRRSTTCATARTRRSTAPSTAR
jgi:phosphoribosylaminoimidazolecarboxamide formyltransferase/IMP cyclohydrolase